MKTTDNILNNHKITIYLNNGVILGPYSAVWNKDSASDIRELSKEFEDYLNGDSQKRFRYHLHDTNQKISNTIIIAFEQVAAIYDQVQLK